VTRAVGALMAGLLFCPVAAGAQATVVVTPTVRVEAVHDSNVLWRPVALEDNFWRLTPSLLFVRDTPRSHWGGDAALDAEWYARHPELSTPFARQHAALRGNMRSTERVRLEVDGAYDSGIRPAELNLTTGLTPGRVPFTRWAGSGETTYAVTPRTRIVGRGQAIGELTVTADAFTQDAEARAHHSWNDRDEFHGRYLAQYFTFIPGSLLSHVMTAGWTRRLTPTVHLELEGGARRALGTFRPEIEATAIYRGQFTDVRLGYAWTHTTAIGVVGLVETQGVVLSVRRERPQGLTVALDAAVHLNTSGRDRTDVYRFSAEILKPVIGLLSIAAGWSLDHHRGLLVPAVDAPGVGAAPPAGDQFTRHVVLVRLQVSGSVRSMAGPREPATARPGVEREGEQP
jgi:hypothetical protein